MSLPITIDTGTRKRACRRSYDAAMMPGDPSDRDGNTRRFATRLAALDPLAPLRSGPEGIVDVSEKVITGVPMHAALHYRAADGGPVAPSGELVAGVTLRDADLRLARLSRARLLDLDARGVSLDGATAIEARLSRVNLAGASMQGVDWRMGREWPGEWNRFVMDALWELESQLGRRMTVAEIMRRVERLMKQRDIPVRFVPYRGGWLPEGPDDPVIIAFVDRCLGRVAS